MSPLSRIVAVCAIASMYACSGSREDLLDNLNTARKDAGPDATTEDSGPDAPGEDAGGEETDAGGAARDASEPSMDATTSDAAALAPLDGASQDTGASEDGSAGPDGGVEADAVVLDASGGDAGAGGDGGEVDSGVAPYLRITVTRGGVPAQDVPVFFSGVEEMLVDVTQTDANGRAQTDQTVYIVTVRLPLVESDVRHHLFSYFHVERGDDLKLEVPLVRGGERQDSYALTTPADAAGISHYEVVGGPGGCARGAVTPPDTRLNVGSEPGCLAAANNTLLVSSWREVPNSGAPYRMPAAYGLVSGLPAPSGQLPNSVPLPTLSAIRDVHLDVSGVPVSSDVQTELWALFGTQSLPLGVMEPLASVSVNASIEYAAPSFAFDALRSHAYYSAGHLTHRLKVRSADSQAPGALQLANALPDITAFTMDDNVLNGPRFYWDTEAAPARDAFLFEGTLNARGAPDVGDTRILWTGVCRPDSTGVRLPPVPRDILVQVPAGSSWFVTRMSQVRSSLVPDYDAFRQTPLNFVPWFGDLVDPPLPAQGETEVATWDHRG